MNVELAADIENSITVLRLLLCFISGAAVWAISGLSARIKKLERESAQMRVYIAQKKLNEAISLQKSARNHPKI